MTDSKELSVEPPCVKKIARNLLKNKKRSVISLDIDSRKRFFLSSM